MRLDYLRYFHHLAKIGNYTKAAKELYIAQPTLSIAIKRMEKELDMQLFVRGEGNSRVELTPEGAVFEEYVEQMLNSFDIGLRVVREMQGEKNSELKIGTIYAMQGRFWSQPLVLGVHRENPLSKKKSISVEELCKYEILTYAITSPANRSLEENLPIENMSLKREYDDEITLSAMVSSDKNKMALFCYSFLVNAFEDVVCIPIKDLPIDFHKVYLISRRETHSKVVDDFISFMGAYRFPNSLELGQIK